MNTHTSQRVVRSDHHLAQLLSATHDTHGAGQGGSGHPRVQEEPPTRRVDMSEAETFVHVIRDAQTGGVYLQHDSTDNTNGDLVLNRSSHRKSCRSEYVCTRMFIRQIKLIRSSECTNGNNVVVYM